VKLAARPPQGNRLLGDEDVVEDNGMRSRAPHSHSFPNVIDANPVGRYRKGKMQDLPACDRIIVLAARDEEVTGNAAAGERLPCGKSVSAFASLQGATGTEPIGCPCAHENFFPLGNGS